MRIFTISALFLATTALAAPEQKPRQATPQPSPTPSAAPAPSTAPSPAPSAKSPAVPMGAAPVSIDRLEASVNSNLIFSSDVDKFRKTTKLRSQLDPLFNGTSLAQEGEKAPLPRVVDFLIDEQIILQQFPVSDTEVEQEINSIQSNNKIDRNQLKAALAQQGESFENYFELIRVSASKRNLIDRDIRTKVSISDDDIKNYFYTHYAQDSGANRIYHLEAILVSPKSYKTPAAAKSVAEKALKEIRSGEPFEEVAKRTSDDASASSGGDLGELTENQMAPVIRDSIRSMKIGQVSSVIGSAKSGFYILKLVNVGSDETGRLDRMKDEIRGQLMSQEYQHQISLWLEHQRQTAFIHRAGESSIAGIPGQTP